MVNGLDHISYSFLHTLACPYAAFLRYEAALRGPTTPWLALGSAVHLGLEIGHREGPPFILKTAVDVFNAEFNRIIEDEEVFVNYAQLKKLQAEGIEMIGGYYEQIQSGIVQEVPMALEEPFEIPIAGTKLVGRIDKVEDDDGIIITDFKTGKAKPDEWFLKHNLQLTAYYWAAFELYGVWPKKLIWHHLRTGDKFETTRTEADVNQLKEMIENAVRMRDMDIKHRIFHEQVCGWCDYKGAVCDDLELEKTILAKRESSNGTTDKIPF